MMPRTLFALLVVIVVVNGKPSCDCDDEYDPWCGEERTYGNLCQLKCAGDEVEGHDTCDNIEKCLEGLADTNDGTEVCAEYGITFDTNEEMECHNLNFVHNGECEN
ncbi:serine protease inhibitor dipetalogastin-like [Mizuhopecten yessoensis]|uniref:serine protease inhibitor dipetalogastin-like n=1 Tax=Mizuhopecten yessoensis TaxID=6573 RepID=UPI000B459CFA|nr:serine protease inhibitor dipetalogastin-like [Mizuhopecten yessoensis]XP_021362396.1 serine protease inhibitor dipetalogastin-like [Mizuhopecten yessoensis]